MPPIEVIRDDYGETINGVNTYFTIARDLNQEGACFIGWSDQEGTHLDILFTYRTKQYGGAQRGIKPRDDLFVSIIGSGSFGFDVKDQDSDQEYYREKLGWVVSGETGKSLTELINRVKKRLYHHIKPTPGQ